MTGGRFGDAAPRHYQADNDHLAGGRALAVLRPDGHRHESTGEALFETAAHLREELRQDAECRQQRRCTSPSSSDQA